jgi:hypothetical protein
MTQRNAPAWVVVVRHHLHIYRQQGRGWRALRQLGVGKAGSGLGGAIYNDMYYNNTLCLHDVVVFDSNMAAASACVQHPTLTPDCSGSHAFQQTHQTSAATTPIARLRLHLLPLPRPRPRPRTAEAIPTWARSSAQRSERPWPAPSAVILHDLATLGIARFFQKRRRLDEGGGVGDSVL